MEADTPLTLIDIISDDLVYCYFAYRRSDDPQTANEPHLTMIAVEATLLGQLEEVLRASLSPDVLPHHKEPQIRLMFGRITSMQAVDAVHQQLQAEGKASVQVTDAGMLYVNGSFEGLYYRPPGSDLTVDGLRSRIEGKVERDEEISVIILSRELDKILDQGDGPAKGDFRKLN